MLLEKRLPVYMFYPSKDTILNNLRLRRCDTAALVKNILNRYAISLMALNGIESDLPRIDSSDNFAPSYVINQYFLTIWPHNLHVRL